MNDKTLKRANEIKAEINDFLTTISTVDKIKEQNLTIKPYGDSRTVFIPGELKESILEQLSDYYYAELDKLCFEFKSL